MTTHPSRRTLLFLAVAIAAVELLAVCLRTPALAQLGWQHATAPYRLVRDADVDPFASFAPTASIVMAQRTIPPEATYAIVVGNQEPRVEPQLVRLIFKLWLLPRRYTARPRDADWVIAYNESSERVGVPYTQEIGLAPGVNALKVAH